MSGCYPPIPVFPCQTTMALRVQYKGMQLRQNTIDGATYKLKRFTTDEPGKQYEYVVTRNGQRVGGGVYTRDEAERMYRELATSESDRPSTPPANGGTQSSGGMVPGVGDGMGGSGPRLPGFGAMDTDGDGDTDDDDEPRLPFM